MIFAVSLVEQATISVSSDSLYPVIGSNVIFTCEVTLLEGEIVSQVWWYFGTELNSDTPRIARWDYFDGIAYFSPYDTPSYQMTFDGGTSTSTLTIDPVQLMDAGTYLCEVIIDGGDVLSDKSTITVSGTYHMMIQQCYIELKCTKCSVT